MRCFAELLLAALAPAAVAWGPDGHKITGQIAASQLSAQELRQLKTVLGGQGLADVATWADDVKHTRAWAWTEELHYINVPDKKCNFDWDRDCKDSEGRKGNCVANAIVNYTQQFKKKDMMAAAGCKGLHKADCLKETDCAWDWTGSWTDSCKDKSPGPGPGPGPSPSGPRDVALKFLVHFVGDIHQPLHVGWTSDQGGNTIDVQEGFDGDKKKKLHQVWDDGIIDKAEENGGFQWQGYATKLEGQVKGAWASDASKWASCLSASSVDLKTCLAEMANESIETACTSAYKNDEGKYVKSGDELDKQYFTTREAIVEQRLAQGGVRLAALLRYALKQAAAAEDQDESLLAQFQDDNGKLTNAAIVV